MTEEEAKTKWCPMVRTALFNESGASGGYNAIPGDNSRCIASNCMMWRVIYRKVTKEDQDICDLYETGDSNIPAGGYCGLAGKP